MDLRNLKVGDKVMRCLGDDKDWMPMEVMAIEGNLLVCAAEGTKGWPLDKLWRFDCATGVEEDHGLGWGVKFGVTGSYLKRMEQKNDAATKEG